TGRQQNTTGQQAGNQTTNRQTVQTQARQQQVANVARGTLEDRDSQFSDFMTIEADERSNALIISGTRSDLELMTELIAKIDV
ncbi:MAG: secretin N-terminal domain-containing protein, partial [Verrucomicrobiia bacterium]